jgi:hypothetical protein
MREALSLSKDWGGELDLQADLEEGKELRG